MTEYCGQRRSDPVSKSLTHGVVTESLISLVLFMASVFDSFFAARCDLKSLMIVGKFEFMFVVSVTV